MSLLSVIVPCYNEEESVALFYQELTKNDTFFKEKDIELELLYIDDGSKDGTTPYPLLGARFLTGKSRSCNFRPNSSSLATSSKSLSI